MPDLGAWGGSRPPGWAAARRDSGGKGRLLPLGALPGRRLPTLTVGCESLLSENLDVPGWDHKILLHLKRQLA
ncbi:unnamed protein product [Coccothraustes coccothraustes]